MAKTQKEWIDELEQKWRDWYFDMTATNNWKSAEVKKKAHQRVYAEAIKKALFNSPERVDELVAGVAEAIDDNLRDLLKGFFCEFTEYQQREMLPNVYLDDGAPNEPGAVSICFQVLSIDFDRLDHVAKIDDLVSEFIGEPLGSPEEEAPRLARLAACFEHNAARLRTAFEQIQDNQQPEETL